jgi:hypothetical protein
MGAMSRGRVVNGILVALVLGGWCGWASGFPESSTGAFVTWSASLAVVVGADALWWWGRRRPGSVWHLPTVQTRWPGPDRDGPRRVPVGVAPWLVLAIVVLAWEVLGIDTGTDQPHLTVSALSQAFRPFHAALLWVWMAVGLGYGVARARLPRLGAETGPPAGLSSVALAGGHPAVGPGTAPALLLPANRAVGVGFWVGLVVVCLLVEVAARRSEGRLATAGDLVRLAARPTLVSLVLVGLWSYAGWHLFAH